MSRFYPSKPQLWSIIPYGIYTAIDLALRCRLIFSPETLQRLKNIPRGSGLILVSNHADEMDIRVYMEFARQAGKRFQFMVNAEAFEEMSGFAGFWMTRVGCFSVERGASDSKAREHALATIQRAKEALVMFPEGEIYYLSDQVQDFKTGAVRLGFEALEMMRKVNPKASVYILPVSLKYRYEEPVGLAIKRRLKELEDQFQIKPRTTKIQERLQALVQQVIERHSMQDKAKSLATHWAKWGEDIRAWRASVLTKLEKKYVQIWTRPSQQLMDRANRLAAEIRDRMQAEPKPEGERLAELRKDFETLKRTVWFAGWAPQYHMENPSAERLAEGIMKLEREILGVTRPPAMGRRSVLIQAGEPVALDHFFEDYSKSPQGVCRKMTDHLHQTIQCLIEQKKPPQISPEFFDSSKPEVVNRSVDSQDGQKVYLDHYRHQHKKLVIIAHGFFNSKSSVLLQQLAWDLLENYDVAVLDFRGHGQSPGLFYWTTKEYLDLEAVIDLMAPQYEAIGLIGFSLGAATSIITASRSEKIKSLIAISPPTEFEKIEYHFWELDPDHDIFYNLVGEGRYGKGVRPGPFWLKKDKPIVCVEKVKAPILFIHGTKDWLIKPNHSSELFKAAKSKKSLVMIEGGPHAEYLLLKNKAETLEPIRKWLRETFD